MKLRYISAISLASVLLMSGCSVFEDVSQKVGYSPKKKVTAEVVTAEPKSEQPASTANDVKKEVATVSESKPEVKKTTEKPQTPAKRQTATKVETKKHSGSQEVSSKDFEKLNGEWSIMSVFGEKIVADEHPMLYFEASSHRFYGNNGCNTINGGFNIPAKGRIELTDVATTMMLCPDAPFEYKINQAIGEVAEYELTTKGQDSFLFFKSEKGGTILTLHRSDNAFIDGAWQVMAVNGDRMAVNDDMRLVIDIAEGRVHGNVGCNMVNGNVLVDTEQTSSIQFTSLMTSRMTCPDQAMETALLLALENVTSWVKNGNTHVILTDAAGKELVKLRKMTREEMGM